MELGITIVGLVTILGAVVGIFFKLWSMVRNVEVTLENHMMHRFDRLEKKIDDNSEKINILIGKLE